MGSKPKAPVVKAPDPVLAAKLQQTLGMFGQRNPYKTLRYEQTGTTPEGVPTWDIIQDFTPDQKVIHEKGMGLKKDFMSMLGSALEAVPQALDYSQLQQISDLNPETLREDYDKYVEYYRPQFERQENRGRERLMAQGFGSGSDVGNQYNRNMGQQWNDLLFKAEDNAFKRAMQNRNEQYRLRNQQISEFLQKQQQPFNVARQLQGLLPQDVNFQFANTSGMTPDILRAQETELAQRNATAQQKYAQRMKNYQQDQSLLGAGVGMLGSALAGPLGGMLAGGISGLFG